MASGVATVITTKTLSNVNHPVVSRLGVMLREFVQWLQAVTSGSFVLILADTTNGNLAQSLPFPAPPNCEVFAIKTSSDGNTFSLVPSPLSSDVINKAGAWAASSLTVGTTQGSIARLKYDGTANWYVF